MRKEKRAIGRFNINTNWDEDIHFIVYDNNTIDCPTLNKENIVRLIIKPRFELYSIRFSRSYKTKYVDHYTYKGGFIKELDMDEDLFDYMKASNMIRYSTETAHLYGFKDKKGFDYKDKTRAFKWKNHNGIKKLKHSLFLDE